MIRLTKEYEDWIRIGLVDGTFSSQSSEVISDLLFEIKILREERDYIYNLYENIRIKNDSAN